MFLLRITKEVNIVENVFFFLIPKDIRTIKILKSVKSTQIFSNYL